MSHNSTTQNPPTNTVMVAHTPVTAAQQISIVPTGQIVAGGQIVASGQMTTKLTVHPVLGQMQWDTQLGRVVVYDGTGWRDSGLIVTLGKYTVPPSPAGPTGRGGVGPAPPAQEKMFGSVVRVDEVFDRTGRPTARWADVCEWLAVQGLRRTVDYDMIADDHASSRAIVFFREDAHGIAFRMIWGGRPAALTPS